MKKSIKILSTVLMICLIISQMSFGVFAEGELPVQLGLKAVGTNNFRYEVGGYVRVNIDLNFGDEFTEANGINVFMFRLNFDPELLTMVDPESPNHEPIYIDDRGKVTSFVDGTEQKATAFRIDDEIAQSRSVTLKMDEGSGALTLLYSGLGEDSDIFVSGSVFQFMFHVNPDLAIDNKLQTAIKLTEPDVSVNNKDVKLDISGDELYIDLTPRFALPDLNKVFSQNTTLKATAWTNINPDDGLPLMAEISKDGEVFAEQEAYIENTHYDIEFEITEDYEPGLYKLTVTYGNTSADTTFNIGGKAEEYVPPVTEPDDSDDKEPDKEPDEEPDTEPDTEPDKEPGKEDNKDNKPTGNGNSTGSNSMTGSVTGIPNNKPDTEKEDQGSTQKPADTTVVYPNDIVSHWAVDNIKYVYDYKLMNGYENGTFLPENSITRAEFATVMARFMGLSANPTAADVFADVNGHWAKDYIGALYEKKIINGMSETEFAPDDNITREQIAVMLCRAFNIAPTGDISVFTDYAQISDWAKDGVLGVYAAGYMKGDTTGAFSPLNNATRAEVATVISRIHKEKK